MYYIQYSYNKVCWRKENVIMKIVKFVSFSNYRKSPKVFPVIIEKYPRVSGPLQFKLMLFKSQLYCTQLKKLVAWKVTSLYCLLWHAEVTEYCRILKYRKRGVWERDLRSEESSEIHSLGRFSMKNMFIMIMLRAFSSLGSLCKAHSSLTAHSSTSISAEEGLLYFWANWD